MTKEEFLKAYYFTFQVIKQDATTLVVITGVIERDSKKVVDTVSTTINITSTNHWNKETVSENSLTEWDWATYIDTVKRFQLDYFGRRIGIEKYFPLDAIKNGDIGEMYK